MKEYLYDKQLNIKTAGEQGSSPASLHYHRYEPTPYEALEQLLEAYEIKRTDRIVDFGCGKGRLNFFLHHMRKATVTGIEMNEVFYTEALLNYEKYIKRMKMGKNQVQFHCCLAEEYELHPQDNRFYFFNPFSVEIFRKVIDRILLSVERHKREVEIILYYASEDYIYMLENHTPFTLKESISLPHIDRDPYEKFLIYHLPY